MLFNRKNLDKKYDIFNCFTAPKFEPNELFPMDPSGTKKYTENDEDGDAAAACAAAQAIADKKPIRKPDPNLRQLQRQISFGSGAPLIGLGSLKKKQMSTGISNKDLMSKFAYNWGNNTCFRGECDIFDTF